MFILISVLVLTAPFTADDIDDGSWSQLFQELCEAYYRMYLAPLSIT